MTMLHHGDLNLPELEGKHYGGTNRGNAITGVKVPADEEVWQTTYAEKLEILGPLVASRWADQLLRNAAGKSESLNPLNR